MGDEYQELLRESWVWMFDRFLPYPFQNNIKFLPKEVVLQKQHMEVSFGFTAVGALLALAATGLSLAWNRYS